MKAKSILIVYEEELDGGSLSKYFHGKGYKVETARVMGEMIRKIRRGNIPVILIGDEIEGVRACDIVPLLKNINPKIQVIVISSEESLGFVKRLRGAGIFYLAMKPVDLGEVDSAVRCAFEKVERERVKEGFFSFLTPELVPA